MTELLPCPFCGGEVRITVNFDDCGNYYYAVDGWPDSSGCKCNVSMQSSRNFPSGTPQDEAKNIMLELINAWNTRYERTCHLVDDPNLRNTGWMRCSECNSPTEKIGAYCQWCGAKVV